jgi:hypothetical protein
MVEREPFINVEDAYWYEPIIEDWTEQLEQLGFEQVKMLFSGVGSQRDSACFEARADQCDDLSQRPPSVVGRTPRFPCAR